MPRKRNVRTEKAPKNKDRTGEMAVAVLIDRMLRDGMTLDGRVPVRVAKLARRLGWSYQETAAFAKKMFGLLADRTFSADEPELPEPEKKPDLRATLTSLLSLAQLALKFMPSGNAKGKGGGFNLSGLLDIVNLFAGGNDRGAEGERRQGKKRK